MPIISRSFNKNLSIKLFSKLKSSINRNNYPPPTLMEFTLPTQVKIIERLTKKNHPAVFLNL